MASHAWTGTFTTSDDTHLQVEIHGGDDKTKPLFIGVHGAPGVSSRDESKTSFAHLHDRCRILFYDSRGSGSSDQKGPFSIVRWVQDLEELRAWMQTETIYLGGGSYGGSVALQYALDYPQRVSGLIIRDSFVDGQLMQRNAIEAFQTTNRLKDKPDLDRQKRLWGGKLVNDADFASALGEIVAAFPAGPPASDTSSGDPSEITLDPADCHAEVANAALGKELDTWNIVAALPRLKDIKTLVTVGRHDLLTPVSVAEQISNAIGANCTLHIFEQSGHSPPEEEHELWIQVVDRWLAQVMTPSEKA